MNVCKRKNCLLIILFLLGAVVIGTVLMMTVYFLPDKRISQNVFESATIFENEGEGPKIWYFYNTARDNYTDAIMLLIASNDSEGSIVDRALKSQWYQTVDEEGNLSHPGPSLIELSKNNPSSVVETSEYSRYWHGYLIWLKPLLCLFNYQTIRWINLIIQLIIDVIIISKLFRMKYRIMSLGYALNMLLLSPVTCGFSLQYSSCWYLFSLGTLMMICMKNREIGFEKYILGYTIIGILTSFFDFLTYPITTLFVPLVFYFLFTSKEGELKFQIKTTVEICLSWGIGYLFMWAGKWIVASILTDKNVMNEAFNSLLYRTGGGEGSIIMSCARNVAAFLINPVTIVAIAVLIILIVKNKLAIKDNFINNKSLIFLIIAIMPFVWYIVAKGHSYQHFWFTFRNLIVTLLAGYAMVEAQIDHSNIKSN